MKTPRLKSQLERIGAIKYGDFKLTSGKTSSVYIEKFRILESGRVTRMFCTEILHQLPDPAHTYFDAVAGMATAGMIVAAELASRIKVDRRIYLEGKHEDMHIARDGSVAAGCRG